jgi:hypothetical protein
VGASRQLNNTTWPGKPTSVGRLWNR